MGITPLPRFGSPVSLQPPAGWLYYVRSALLSVFFPAGCRICDRMLTEATRIPICNECLGSFQQIPGTVCDTCGTPVENAPTENKRVFVCPRRTSPDHRSLAFDRVRSWSFYDGTMVQAILFLKFENIEPLGELFARMLAEMAVLGGPAFEGDESCPSLSSPPPTRARLQSGRPHRQTARQTPGLSYKSVLLTRIRRPRPEKHLRAGSPFVALLPHVRAAKLTIYASYW